MKPSIAVPFAAAALFAALASVALAAPPEAASVPKLSGGIGTEERQAMQAARDQYNLRLSFAQQGGGAFVAGVSVKIDGLNGAASFGPFDNTGPQFYVKLPAGEYRVAATYQGDAKTQTVNLGKGAVDHVFYWSGK